MNEVLWAAQAGYPPLATLQWLPLAAAVLLMIMREDDLALVLGRLFAVAELVVAIDLYARIDVTRNVLQFAERLDVFAYHAAADGVSVLFILLTALLGVLLSFYGMARQQLTPVQLLSVLLLIESSQMVMLTTMNLLWFAAASAVQLALVGYLLWRWASAREENLALARFLQYQLFGWCLFVAGAVVLVWSHADVLGGHWSFDLFDLLQTPQFGKYQSVAFYLLFYGLAIRLKKNHKIGEPVHLFTRIDDEIINKQIAKLQATDLEQQSTETEKVVDESYQPIREEITYDDFAKWISVQLL